MKNIHLIPTDKPSRLHLGKSGLVLCDLVFNPTTINSQNIYITSNEGIKDGDWCFGMDGIFQYKGKVNLPDVELPKKIILTTDPDLIKDGVQAIDDEFLQWFVKNNSCEEVEVIKNYLSNNGQWKDVLLPSEWEIDTKIKYKIIIPQEEPKQYPSIHCDEACYYHCTKGGTQSPDCKKEEPKQTDENGKPITYWGGLEEPKQEGYICPHPERRKDYYRNGCFKCWECGKIVVEHNNFIEQGTLEEVAEKYLQEWRLVNNIHLSNPIHSERCKNDFKAGAKWQQEQDKNKYSEEEVRQMLWELGDVLFNNNQNGIEEGDPEKYFDGIIEQFKKQRDGDN
jgi:hypothetical protein